MQSRHHPDFDRNLLADVEDPTKVSPRSFGDRDHNVIDPMLSHQCWQVLGCAENLYCLNHRPLLVRIVIHESSDVEIGISNAEDFLGSDHSGSSSTNQQHTLLFLTGGASYAFLLQHRFVNRTPDYSKSQNSDEREEAIHQRDGKRNLKLLERVWKEESGGDHRHGWQ